MSNAFSQSIKHFYTSFCLSRYLSLIVLKTINERHLEKQKDVYICFIDNENAFDRVNHEMLIEKLKLAGMDGKDVRIIVRLYCEPTKETQKVSKSLDRDVCYHHTFPIYSWSIYLEL